MADVLLQEARQLRDGMGWDGMGWDGMGWDGMGWDGMGWDGGSAVGGDAAAVEQGSRAGGSAEGLYAACEAARQRDQECSAVDQLQHMSKVPNSPQIEHLAVSEHASSAAMGLQLVWVIGATAFSTVY